MHVSSWSAGTASPSFDLLWGVKSYGGVSLGRMTAKQFVVRLRRSFLVFSAISLKKTPFYLILCKSDCRGTQISGSAWMTPLFHQQWV